MPIGMLQSILWSKNLISETKTMCHKNIVEDVNIVSGAETWTMKTKQQKRLLSAEMEY